MATYTYDEHLRRAAETHCWARLASADALAALQGVTVDSFKLLTAVWHTVTRC